MTASASHAVRTSHDIEEAGASVARLTHGTTAPEPPATIGAWDSAAEHARHAAELLHAGNASLAAYLKAIGSGAGSPLIEPIKSGADLLEESNDTGAQLHRARRTLINNVDGVGERFGKALKLQRGIARKPPGDTHAETRPPSSIGSTHQDFPVENAFAAIVVAAVIVPQAVHWAINRIWRRIRNG